MPLDAKHQLHSQKKPPSVRGVRNSSSRLESFQSGGSGAERGRAPEEAGTGWPPVEADTPVRFTSGCGRGRADGHGAAGGLPVPTSRVGGTGSRELAPLRGGSRGRRAHRGIGPGYWPTEVGAARAAPRERRPGDLTDAMLRRAWFATLANHANHAMRSFKWPCSATSQRPTVQ